MNITNVLTASQRVRIVAIEKTPKRITLRAVSTAAQAEQSTVPEVRSFAVGLRHEYAAVAAALEYPWSKGPVEGHVNRLKTIKRQMYGRANFDLLKTRVLYIA
jgi:transposase